MSILTERLMAHAAEKRELERLLRPYWEFFRDRWNSKPWMRRLEQEPDSIEICGNGDVVFHKEYNDACHCHPEFADAAFELPLMWTGLTVDELRAKLDEIDRQYREKKAAEGKCLAAAKQKTELERKKRLLQSLKEELESEGSKEA